MLVTFWYRSSRLAMTKFGACASPSSEQGSGSLLSNALRGGSGNSPSTVWQLPQRAVGRLLVAVWAEPLRHALRVVLLPMRSTWSPTPGSAGWECARRTPSSNPNFCAQTFAALAALLATAGRALPGRRVFGMVSALLRTRPPTTFTRRVCALCTPCAPPGRSGQRRVTRGTRVGALQTLPLPRLHASAPGMINLLPWARAPTASAIWEGAVLVPWLRHGCLGLELMTFLTWWESATPSCTWWESAGPAPTPERRILLPFVAGPFAFGTLGGLADATHVFRHVFGMVLVILRAAPAAALAWRVGTTAAPAIPKVSDRHLPAALRARQPTCLLWWRNFQPRFLARLGRENAYVLLQSSSL